jgi:hypothetical protein
MMSQLRYLLLVVVVLAMSGCATNGQPLSPNIDRISEEELARIMPTPVATLSLDDLVHLSKTGATAEQIIAQIKASNSYYDLTPSQSVLLNKQGVDSQVLDYIHVSREQALRNNVADEINKREKIKRTELERLKRQQQLNYYDPFCRYGAFGMHPYGYGAYGSRFGWGTGFSRQWGCW